MKKAKFLIFLGTFFLLISCVPSLHPLYTEKDLVFDRRLVGTWQEDDEKDIWTFRKSGDKAYEMIFHQNGNPAKFETHLVQLGDYRFLDFFPDPDDELGDNNEFFQLHLIPTHTFARVWIDKKTLKMAPMNPGWFKDLASEGKVGIPHEKTEGGYIITASTEELQKFILKYAEDEEAFEAMVLHRTKDF